MIPSTTGLLLGIGVLLVSTSITTQAAKSGFLSNGLLRGVAGGGTFITSGTFLVGYTNLESFITASINGSLGISGFVFLGGFIALLVTWASNFYNYAVVIK